MALDVSNRDFLAGNKRLAAVRTQSVLKLAQEFCKSFSTVLDRFFRNTFLHPLTVEFRFPQVVESFNTPVGPVFFAWSVSVKTVLAADKSYQGIRLVVSHTFMHQHWDLGTRIESISFELCMLLESQPNIFVWHLSKPQCLSDRLSKAGEVEVIQLCCHIFVC